MRTRTIPSVTLGSALLILGSAAAIGSEPLVDVPYMEQAPGTFDISDQLLNAADEGDLERVRSLLAAGADPNVWTVTGRTPLRNAIRHPK